VSIPAPGFLAFVIGLLLGAMFFGGLWWTVRTALGARNPVAWFPASLLLRAGLLGVGFYYVAAAGWQALLLCTGGFLIARGALIHLSRVAAWNPHAP
jgi:F1F0 ATPase subunit 2